eukprot:6698167-Alexandrium_andersonii.AAC.1
MTSSLRPPDLPLGEPGPELCGVPAALRVRPALLEFALDDQLLGRFVLAHEEAPQLEAQCVSGQLRLGHPESVGDGAL